MQSTKATKNGASLVIGTICAAGLAFLVAAFFMAQWLLDWK